jgi:hypothetical protein
MKICDALSTEEQRPIRRKNKTEPVAYKASFCQFLLYVLREGA